MFQVNPLIHMKNQALFSSKDKSKKLKCCLLQFLYGALRIKRIKENNTSLKAKFFLLSFFEGFHRPGKQTRCHKNFYPIVKMAGNHGAVSVYLEMV